MGSTTAASPIVAEASDDDTADIERAVDIAHELLATSIDHATRSEQRRLARLGALLADHDGRELIFALTDQVMRIESPRRAAERFADIVRQHPTRATGPVDRLLLRAGTIAAVRLPRLVMPLVRRRIEHETRGIVLPADDPAFANHLRRRRADGVRLNVNPLGEAILSDREADERLRVLIERIERADVDYVSARVSSIVANLDPLAFDHSVDRIVERLRTVYRAARDATPATFVNLDMEEYRDLELTLEAFTTVLAEPEFHDLDAGIVLQAYLPDSHDALERLGTWAARRAETGGGSVKVRLVKGANLAMERAEAELHGWTAAPYPTKADVDASYKAMLDSALRPEWADALRLGVASHNLFDVAWALVRAERDDAFDRIEFEMLEGMAPAQARAVQERLGTLLMYAPVVADDDFDASIAYLTRRLDENTQPDNFLRALFTLTPGSPEFAAEADRFRDSARRRHAIRTAAPTAEKPRSRRRPEGGRPLGSDRDPGGSEGSGGSGFRNAPDTDMTDPAARDAVMAAIETPPAPMVHRVESDAEIDEVVTRAIAAHSWRHDTPVDVRRRWLLATADLMEEERHTTIGLLAHHAAKTVHESDPEISEAIDFCRYYAIDGRQALDDAIAAGVEVDARGIVAVIGPWNFPYAIPTGGVAAALAVGNSVILKPAPETIHVGAWIVEQFHRAGVPRDVLQLVVCDDGPVGRRLVTHPDIDTVVLTGSHATASAFLDWKPDLRLFAETSGKDALVITPSADLDLAIADLVRSAFGHAGQKCSAASLGIVVGEVYDDPSFRRRLCDAVLSLRVGPATDPASMVGPLIAAPTGPLERALTRLDAGESWLVEPECLDRSDDRDGVLWRPGVRLGVAAGSWFHETECFGPVLGLMRADDLDHAIDLQNGTAFGLTGGIHTLDDGEIERWLDRVQVGNAYVNRHITGAIVRRQPFGGWKRSSVGGGAKAGGPAYVAQFAARRDDRVPDIDVERVRASFRTTWDATYAVAHDPTGLDVEANVLRHVPLTRVAARTTDASRHALFVAAAEVAGVDLVGSDPTVETDVEFARRVVGLGVDRVRVDPEFDVEARRVLHAADIPVDTAPPVADAVLELHHWVREQSISHTTHRHGRPTTPSIPTATPSIPTP